VACRIVPVTRYAFLAVAVSAVTAPLWARTGAPILPLGAEATVQIPYAEARPILELLRPNLPSELATKTPAELESAWPDWVSRRDVEIRRRLDQGDEDSLFNLLLFGTSFTRLPRALNDSTKIGGPRRGAEIVRGRIADLVAGIASPGANERLLFARELIARQGIDPATPSGQEQVRLYLLRIMKRVVGEVEDYTRTINSARSVTDALVEVAARSTLFHARGLSSDTSIRADFAIDQALETIASRGMLGRGSVRRAAVIGPGLDFTDKAEGYDFYPTQTIQPFSVIDSLRRLGLADPEGLRLTTFDLSPRINRHLEAARRRASEGGGYIVVLPHDRDVSWRAGLLRFWNGFGRAIGEETTTAASPPAGVSIDVRAVAVRPDIVLSIEPRDLNVVLERLAPSAADETFDVIVATNIFVYYDAFEQSLALANVASMLRPGGLLLSNDVLLELPTTPIHSAGDSSVTYTDRSDDNDHIVWYQRR
jgi:hypothetical protein